MAAAQHQRAGALPQQRGHALAQRVLRRFQRVALAGHVAGVQQPRQPMGRQADQACGCRPGRRRAPRPGYAAPASQAKPSNTPSPALAWPS